MGLVLVLIIFFPVQLTHASDRPNIVLLLAEDIGPELSCYGHPAVHTPNIDRLAQRGVRYTQVFGTASSCAPNRNAMMLGMYQTRTDTQDQRRQTEVPRLMGLKTFPESLRAAGYYNVVGHPNINRTYKLDLSFKPIGKMFDSKHWGRRKAGQPFFAHITLASTHRNANTGWGPLRSKSKHPVDPNEVKLPSYIPDDPDKVCRLDWAQYLDAIQHIDGQVGQIMGQLEREGILSNTTIIFIADNGQCHLRGKCWLYDAGMRVPMVISGKGFEAGTVNDDLISSIDLPATILDMAGAEIPDGYDGRSLLSEDHCAREHVFGASDLVGQVMDRIRAVRSKRFKYIRNYHPEKGYIDSEYVRNNRPMRAAILKLKAEGKLTPAQQLFFAEHKPTVEFYDLEKDPFEVNNLADDPSYSHELQEMSSLLDHWIIDTKDHGLSNNS